MTVIGFVEGRTQFFACSDGQRRALPSTPMCRWCSKPIAIKYRRLGKCAFCNEGDPVDGKILGRVIAGSMYIPEWREDVQTKELYRMKKDGSYAHQYAEMVLEVLRRTYGSDLREGVLVPAPARPGADNLAPRFLTRELSTMTKLEVVDALRYARPVSSQKDLSRSDRKQNVANSIVSDVDLSGDEVYIVDDIMTTGYGLRDAARAIYESGPQNGIVWGLVAARDVREHELIDLGIVVTDVEQ